MVFFHLGSEGEEIRFKNVQEMAKAYLDRLLDFYPAGPFLLAGFSFGGILAFEMAVQLQKAGKVVRFLALIDSSSPLAKEPVIWQKGMLSILKKNILNPARRVLLQKFSQLRYRCYFLFGKPLPVEIRKSYIWFKYGELSKKYSPEKFNGNLLLFKTKENRSTYEYLGWESLADNVKLFDVDGKHTEIFWNKSSVETIATEIARNINLGAEHN